MDKLLWIRIFLRSVASMQGAPRIVNREPILFPPARHNILS